MPILAIAGFGDVLTELVAVLVVAAAIGLLAVRFRQPVILAFIAAGVAVGPSALGWVRSADQVHLLAEMGLSILLFVVGLRLDLHIMRSVGRVAVTVGLCQVLLTGLGGYGIARLLGATPTASVYLALAMAFSSTVIAVKMLSDKRDLDSLYGRLALGILLTQDVMVVLVLAVLPALGNGANSGTALAVAGVVAKGAGLLLGTGLLGLFVLPRLIDKVSTSAELLLLVATSWALAVATVSGMLGLSKEVGAFLAGVALASSQHKDILGAKLVSLRDFLLLFFFLELGSRLNLRGMGASAAWTVPLSIWVLVGKPAIITSIIAAMGYRVRTGFLAGITLSQTSEFSLILASAGAKVGHLEQGILGLITLTTAVTIAVSASLVGGQEALYQRLSRMLPRFRRTAAREQADDAQQQRGVDVILFGLGRYGTIMARELIDRGRTVLGVDFDPQAVKASNAGGIPAVFGDAEDPEYLGSLPLAYVKWVVCSIRDENITRRLTTGLKQHGYTGIVALTADDATEATRLTEGRADLVFVPFEDSAIQAVDLMETQEAQIERNLMDKQIEAMNEHYIICGYGRMGQQIVKDLQRAGVLLVVVESNPEQLPRLTEARTPHVIGKASEDKTLLQAGITRAKGLISVCPTDEDNVFIVLTARVLNPKLFIVARSILEENVDKLRRAGADKVMSPYILGGRQMAAAVVRPQIMEFVDLVLHSDQFDTNVAHIVVSADSPRVGQSLSDMGLWQNCGVTVLAVRRNGDIDANPCPTYKVQAGDELICMGSEAQIEAARVFLS